MLKAGHGTERETVWTRRDAERVTHDAKGNRTDERGALGEQRATKREKGTAGAETSGGRRVTKRENDKDEKETSSRQRATRREAGIAREGDGKPQARRREGQC